MPAPPLSGVSQEEMRLASTYHHPPAPPPSYFSHNFSEDRKSRPISEDADEDEEKYVQDEDEEEDVQDEADEDATSRAMHEIFRFISLLRAKQILTREQSVLLEDLLFEKSTVLYSAYSVAFSQKTAEYFAQMCVHIAVSLQSEEGRNAREAQDKVLHACDVLFLKKHLTEDQLLYLRHLTLISDDAIKDIYDQYSESGSTQDLCVALYRLVRVHPTQIQQEQQNHFEQGQDEKDDDEEDEEDGEDESSDEDADDDEDEDEDDQDEISGKQTFGPAHQEQDGSGGSRITMNARLPSFVSQMFQADLISKHEGRLLLEMIANGDDICQAAYSMFVQDSNARELCDTLLRCVKLHIRKQAYEEKAKAYDARQEAEQDESDDDEESEESDEESEESESEEEGNDSESSESQNLTRILNSFGLRNQWQKTVPLRFVSIVFSAAQSRILEIGQARALCDLYQAQYDLVRAAFEVYLLESDERDFIDTLKRVVRELSFDEAGNIIFQGEEDAEPIKVSAEEAVNSQSAVENKAPNIAVEKQAVVAVNIAKQNLLKHSLQMMREASVVSDEEAQRLIDRFDQGDAMVDSAIHQYSSSRNVQEFLETLQLLASLTKEEIEKLMQGDLSGDEDEEEEKEESASEVEDEESGADALNEEEEDEDESGDEPEEDSENDMGMRINALIQLKERELLGVGMFLVLKRLVLSKHDHVMAVFDVFNEMGDVEDLLDSLRRIARHHGAPSDNTTQSPNANNSYEGEEADESDSEESEDESDDENEQEWYAKHASQQQEQWRQQQQQQQQQQQYDDEESESSDDSEDNSESDGEEPGMSEPAPTPELPIEDQKKVVGIVAKAGAFNETQVAYLDRLIDTRDSKISTIFFNYVSNRDVPALVMSLKQLSDTAPSASPAPVPADSSSESEESEEEEEEDSDDDAAGSTNEAEIEQKFLQIVRDIKLTHLETAALRLAIARGDPAIKTSLEKFRLDLNETNLTVSLRNIARATMVATLEGKIRE